MEQKIINSTKIAVDDLVKLAMLSKSQLWVDYDKEVDVLYLNFDKPQKADNSIQDGHVIKRFRSKKLVGLTILNAARNKRRLN